MFLSIETLVSYVMTAFIYRTFTGKLNINFNSDLLKQGGNHDNKVSIKSSRQFFFLKKSSKTMYSLNALGKLVSIMCLCFRNVCQQFSLIICVFVITMT